MSDDHQLLKHRRWAHLTALGQLLFGLHNDETHTRQLCANGQGQEMLELSDQDASPVSPLVAAVQWVQHMLLGTLATSVAILAVATIGAMMLSGRLSFRRWVGMVLGCFILFGASSIAQALASGISQAAPLAPVVTRPVVHTPQTAPAMSYDPYSGASAPSATTPDDLFQPSRY